MSSSTPRLSLESTTSLPPNSSSSDHLPFPQHDPFQRYGSRYQLRRGSSASSITSVGGILDAASQSRGESIAESGQNAISTLLQPPIVRTGLLPHTSLPASSAYKAPSTKDIPPVVLANIPHVETYAFQRYIRQVGSLYEAFRKAKEEGQDGGPQLFRRKESSKLDGFEDVIARSIDHRRVSTSSISSRQSFSGPLGSPLEIPRPMRRPSGQKRMHQVTPLSTIPPVYFEDDFHLENPRTFDVVSERSEIVRKLPKTPDGKIVNGSAIAPLQAGRKALATNAILQEKLSWYMDTVEVHLISSISSASTSFFTALGSLRELHSEAATSVDRIQSLRKDLAKLDKDMASGGLKVVNMRRRRENVRKLGEAVEQLRQVVAAVAQCEDKVDQGDVDNAMDSLDAVENLIAGRGDKTLPALENCKPLDRRRLVDLRNIKALEGASGDLNALKRRIGKAVETRFLEAILGDLRRHVDSVPPQTTLKRWGMAWQRSRGNHHGGLLVSQTYLNFDDDLRSTLRALLNSLSRADHIEPAASAFRDAIAREMKSLIRRRLPSSSDDDNESVMSASTHGGGHLTQREKSSILARNLRSIDADDAETMLLNIYASIGESLRRLSIQAKVLLDLSSDISSPITPTSNSMMAKDPTDAVSDSNAAAATAANADPALRVQLIIQQSLDMSSLLGLAIDVAQSQISKVLRVRSEQVSRLSLTSFLHYFALNRLFVNECEAVSGRSANSLTNVVDGQIKEFLTTFGDAQRRILVENLDSDKWDAKDFTPDDDLALREIIESSTCDPEAWIRGTIIWEDSSSPSPGPTSGSSKNGTTGKTRSAVLDGQSYMLTRSTILVVHILNSILRLTVSIPSLVPEATALTLDILRLFNSRSVQLILGAGATRSAGLKNITTKHLALASQALSFLGGVVTYVREFVRRKPGGTAGGNVAQFDKVKRLFQDHQTAIYDKLVEIMSNRSNSHLRAFQGIDWDSADAGDGNPSAYMETLTRETATLVKVLRKFLPDGTMDVIVKPVLDNYREVWGKAFREVTVRTEVGKSRLLLDAQTFRARISKLDPETGLGDVLVKLVSDKVPLDRLGEDGKPKPDESKADSNSDGAGAENGKGQTTG